MNKRRNNGQKYYQLTQEAIAFFNNEYIGNKSALVRASGLAARTIAKAFKGEAISVTTSKAIRKVLQDAGFKGDAFIEVI